MRNLMSVILAAAFLAIGAIAFAASQHGIADLQSLSASGVTGQARLNEVQPDKVNFQAQIRGLDPGAAYRIEWYTNTSCTAEADVKVIEAFKANPAGMASIQATLARNIEEFGSIGVVRVSDLTVVACGAVQQTQ
jgi:hypothetical protein